MEGENGEEILAKFNGVLKEKRRGSHDCLRTV